MVGSVPLSRPKLAACDRDEHSDVQGDGRNIAFIHLTSDLLMGTIL